MGRLVPIRLRCLHLVLPVRPLRLLAGSLGHWKLFFTEDKEGHSHPCPGSPHNKGDGSFCFEMGCGVTPKKLSVQNKAWLFSKQMVLFKGCMMACHADKTEAMGQSRDRDKYTITQLQPSSQSHRKKKIILSRD